jgi:Icc protein
MDNNNKLIIAQISDIHIGEENEIVRGINVRNQFLDVLQVLRKKELDILIVSGDLAATHGEIEIYQWIKQKLDEFPYPYIIMPGNHDNVSMMSQVFDFEEKYLHNAMLYFHRILKGRHFYFLDSQPYFVASEQLDWLKKQLMNSNEEAFLFIHHPPLLCECEFMDKKHALRNRDTVWQILSDLTAIKHIFCGHYHTEKLIEKDGKFVHLTPSTMLQIDTKSFRFDIASTIAGWRMIEWQGDHLNTYVEYLN